MRKIKRLCYNKYMRKKSCGGFTLIELSLSLIFIAILSLMVVFLIQNISASYRRGLILNQVNTVGMDLVDDFRISVQNATSDPVTRMCEIYYPDNDPGRPDHASYEACVKDNANSFVSVSKLAQVKIDGDYIGTNAEDSWMPVYGAFCTGTYTYIWNSGYFENADNIDFDGAVDQREVIGAEPAKLYSKDIVISDKDKNSYFAAESTLLSENFRLLKVYDDERTICVNAMREQNTPSYDLRYKPSSGYDNNAHYNNDLIPKDFVINQSMLIAGDNEPIELMKSDKISDLVLYEFYLAKPALSSTRENLFYAASFILGTRRGGINIMKAGNTCRPPNDDYSELEYCAINKFNFAVMAGGK